MDPDPGRAENDPLGGPIDEPPPVLGSWRRLYALVIANLLLLIALCGWLARLGR